jgi:hypothetical protein
MDAVGSVIFMPSSGTGPGGLGIVTPSLEMGGDEDTRLVAPSVQPVDTGSRAEESAGPAPTTAVPVPLVDPGAIAQIHEKVGRIILAGAKAAREGLIRGNGPFGLTAVDRQRVDELQRIDSAVRQEEKAHAARAGRFAGPPTYTFERGPDGKRYAVAGSVSIRLDLPLSDPATVERALEAVRQAALAPHAPSAQDFRVARLAAMLAGQARAFADAKAAGRILDIAS